MDPKLEETLRKALDKLLQYTLENLYLRVMNEELLSNVKSKKDFLFGVVVGDMLEGLGLCTYAAHKRYPKDQEFRELFKMIQERASEIQSKTRIILVGRR
jgi:hypothetical protein